jgi:hypothetical protein
VRVACLIADKVLAGGAMSVPEELKGRKGDMLVARVILPMLVAIVYGLYEFIAWGASSEFYLYTYVPVFGGIAAVVGLMAYYFCVLSPNFAKISWKNLLLLLGFLPYGFLTYVIVFFGLYAIYRGVFASFSIRTIRAFFGLPSHTMASTNFGL